MRTGVHIGLGQGYEEALAYASELGCETAQIFTHSPRMFKFKPLDDSRQKVLRDGWKKHNIHPVVSHASYLINIGSTDNKKFYGALGLLKNELIYAAAFGCQYVVYHVGKHTTATVEEGMAQVVKGLDKLLETLKETGVMLLLEGAAGQGTELGRTFEELQEIFQKVKPDIRKHLGVCLDTCHMFAAGYDLSKSESVVKNIKNTIGVDSVKVIHVNDSKFPLGEKKDRHDHIGEGHIGTEGLKAFLTRPEWKDIPMILETPIDDRGDQYTDLEALRKILGKD
ncbi:deoxyribonuclease IV [Candidatus Woesearchaeota archaeon]|nr:deoxyribonuclease IV [Candidatus Woesearchaeota archaeon]